MARIFVTGSTTGLGRAAAEAMLDDGHEVVLHARNAERANAVDELAARGVPVVLGDLSRREDVLGVADQVNALGRVDAVIHNAAIYVDDRRVVTEEGLARTMAVNVVAPYVLTAWIASAGRHIYLSSGMHRSGGSSLLDPGWNARGWDGVQAYCDSKLYVTTLALALARRQPARVAHAVDPGWVPTRMGGAGAPDDLELGHQTQAWLAVTADPDTATAGYWHHRHRQAPAAAALDEAFQDRLLDELERLTQVRLG